MKKLLTSVLTLTLLCCFTFVGCKKEEEPKPATIEQTLAICDQFIADMQAIKTKISAQNYEYPTSEAQASAKQVEDTDKSSIGIEYSNYDEFDYNYEFMYNMSLNTNISVLYSVKDLYLDREDLGGINLLDAYVKMYIDNNWELDKTYKFYYYDGESEVPEYTRLINNNSKISLYIMDKEDDAEYFEEYVINLNDDLSWKSFEIKECLKEQDTTTYMRYICIENATDSNRIFNRYIVGDFNTTHCRLINTDEEAQKILCVEKFGIDTMSLNPTQNRVYNYLSNLNIQNIQNEINTGSVINTEVLFDDYYVES